MRLLDDLPTAEKTRKALRFSMVFCFKKALAALMCRLSQPSRNENVAKNG